MSYLYYTQTAGVVKIVNPPNPPFLDVWGLCPHAPGRMISAPTLRPDEADSPCQGEMAGGQRG